MKNKINITSIGGLEYGAFPIAFSAMREIKFCNAFNIRKNKKEYGINSQIDGLINVNDKVAIVEDVVTTGGSLIKAINISKENNLNPIVAITILDRKDNNLKDIIDIPYYSILTIDDFI